MIGFGDFSEDGWSPRAGDPIANRGWLDSFAKGAGDAVRLPVDLFDPDKRADAGAMFRATERKQLFADTIASRGVAIEGAFQSIADQVRSVTGVVLDNPLTSAQEDHRRALGERAWKTRNQPDFGAFLAKRSDDFFARVRELKAQKPDELGGLPDSLDAASAARNLARSAEEGFAREWQRTDGNAVMELGAMLAGGIWGSRRDPLFWASFAAPGGGQGATALARVANAAITQGGVNAAFQAAAQPIVQAWRAEAGLASGIGEAFRDIAMAGLFGAAAGGVFQGAIVEPVRKAIQRLANGRGDASDLRTILEAQGREAEPDSILAIGAAKEADAADAAFLAAAKNIAPDAARLQARDGLVHLEDPSAPLPLIGREIPKGVDDVVASGLVRPAPDLEAAIGAVRAGGDDAILSALSSANPALRDVGRLASLDPDQLARARENGVPPDQAALVPAMTQDPARQAAMLETLLRERPQTIVEAREALTGQLAAENAIDSAVARVGRRRRLNRPLSLTEFLAMEGGLKPDPELKQIFGGENPFIPGFGRLIRENGMALDHAWEKAAEARYLFDPEFLGVVPGEVRTRWHDLVDLIADERSGRKIFAAGEEPELAAGAQIDAERAIDRHAFDAGLDLDATLHRRATRWLLANADDPAQAIGMALAQKDFDRWQRSTAAKFGLDRDPEARALAIKIMARDNVADPEHALERAAIQLADEPPRKVATDDDIPFDVSVDAATASRPGEEISRPGGGADAAAAAREVPDPGGDPRGPGEIDRTAPGEREREKVVDFLARRTNDDALQKRIAETRAAIDRGEIPTWYRPTNDMWGDESILHALDPSGDMLSLDDIADDVARVAADPRGRRAALWDIEKSDILGRQAEGAAQIADRRAELNANSPAPVPERADGDRLNLTPVELDGDIRFMTQADAAKASPREAHVADVVRACKA